ncbi:MAG TPA: hypothetical protein VF469_07760 [Kofleriaceae bacterium]
MTAPVDPTRRAAVCATCHAGFATDLALDLATGAPPYRPSEARWVLVPLLGAFAAALGLLAVSQLAAFLVWLAGSAATVVLGAWHARLFERTPPRPITSLPSAVTVSRREKPHRSLPPSR